MLGWATTKPWADMCWIQCARHKGKGEHVLFGKPTICRNFQAWRLKPTLVGNGEKQQHASLLLNKGPEN